MSSEVAEAATPETETPVPAPVGLTKLRFTVSLREEKFDIEIDGQEKEYTLKQVPSNVFAKWQSDTADRYRKDKDGRVIGGISKFDGWYTSLLCKAVFDESGQPVGQKTLDTWPAGVIDGLYERLGELQLMTKNAIDQAKKA